jgi:hypothetical protein
MESNYGLLLIIIAVLLGVALTRYRRNHRLDDDEDD